MPGPLPYYSYLSGGLALFTGPPTDLHRAPRWFRPGPPLIYTGPPGSQSMWEDSGNPIGSSGILEYFVGAHSLNILSRLESLSGGPSGGGYNCWQLRPHGNMGMAVPSHHPGHLTWDQGCIWYFGRWEVHRSSPNHSQTRSFNRKSQNTSLLVILYTALFRGPPGMHPWP